MARTPPKLQVIHPGETPARGRARPARAAGGRILVRAAGPGLLVLSEGYDPGFSARVDGRPARVLRVNVDRMRYVGVVLSGVLTGLAGAYLSIGFLNQFVRGMSAGMGFIALAALIFGKWHPVGILFSTLLFGFASALAIQLQGSEILPAVLVQAFPYVVTVLVLAGFIGKSRPPAAVGKPYEK